MHETHTILNPDTARKPQSWHTVPHNGEMSEVRGPHSAPPMQLLSFLKCSAHRNTLKQQNKMHETHTILNPDTARKPQSWHTVPHNGEMSEVWGPHSALP